MATLAPDPTQPTLLDLLEQAEAAPAPVAEAAVAPAPAPSPGTGSSDHTLAGERTLEALVLGAWEELAVARTASCPLCAGPLVPRFGAGARPVGARCGGCGTEVG